MGTADGRCTETLGDREYEPVKGNLMALACLDAVSEPGPLGLKRFAITGVHRFDRAFRRFDGRKFQHGE